MTSFFFLRHSINDFQFKFSKSFSRDYWHVQNLEFHIKKNVHPYWKYTHLLQKPWHILKHGNWFSFLKKYFLRTSIFLSFHFHFYFLPKKKSLIINIFDYSIFSICNSVLNIGYFYFYFHLNFFFKKEKPKFGFEWGQTLFFFFIKKLLIYLEICNKRQLWKSKRKALRTRKTLRTVFACLHDLLSKIP